MKRCVASVTDLWAKYRYDVYTRTRWNVVLLQVVYVVVILGLFWFTLTQAHRQLVETMLTSIAQVLARPEQNLAEQIPLLIRQTKIESLAVLFFLLTFAATAFGLVVAHITLQPARRTLELQKKFIANVAHELRTPLAVLRTNNEVALLTEDPPPNLERVLAHNLEEVERITTMLNTLLSFNELYQPGRLNFAPVALTQVLERVLESLDTFARERGIELVYKPSPVPDVDGNEAALVQLSASLIKNALMFSPRNAGRVVRVEVVDRGDGVEVTVEDQGVGMDDEELLRVREPFYRVDKSRARASGSVGLGLTMVSEIVRIHRGTLLIRSALGKGTTVTVRLPSARHLKLQGGSSPAERATLRFV